MYPVCRAQDDFRIWDFECLFFPHQAAKIICLAPLAASCFFDTVLEFGALFEVLCFLRTLP
jgi:hypothetical protein